MSGQRIRIQPRDERIVRDVFLHRVAPRDGVIGLGHFDSVPRCNERLGQLARAGWLRRIGQVNGQEVRQGLYAAGPAVIAARHVDRDPVATLKPARPHFPATLWKSRGIWSGRRDSNSRPSRWQRDALPLSYSRKAGLLYPTPYAPAIVAVAVWVRGAIIGDVPDTAFLTELGALAFQAGQIAQTARFELERELKPDGSIVTNGDRTVEEFLRPKLVDLQPGSTVWGEEFGFSEEGEGGLWVVDPIDGTSNYAYGSPLWGVSVGLLQGEEILAGAIMLPDLEELYLALPGAGASLNGRRLEPLPPGRVQKQELVSYSDTLLRTFPGRRWPGKMRCSGAFVVDACFAFRQRFRGMIGIREKLYDMAPAVLMGRELGADVRYADGRPLLIEALKADEKIEHPWIIFPAESGFLLEDVAPREVEA
jgi:fructose-1,6-bisphosphatase/inositol monophosphatase family enzyme